MNNPLSFVHPNAKIGRNVIIDPFAYIDDDVVIGDNTHIYSNAVIFSGSRIGCSCQIYPCAVIGAVPQDLKFNGEKTYAYIGDRTVVRESATIHRGTASKGKTVVGDDCLIMAYCHVAHDCRLGNNIIMSNATQLAGEVVVDDYAVLGGGSLIHQFTRIGKHVMLQGGSRVNKDIPPFTTAGHDPIAFAGINSIGLRRRGFSNEQIDRIQNIYRLLYNPKLNVSDAITEIELELPASAERDEVILFIRNSSRGIIRSKHE